MTAATTLPWLELRAATQPTAPCIVALHGSFGAPRDWKLVAARMTADASMHALALAPLAQLPALDMAHAAAAVAATVRTLRAVRPGAPLVLAGYSFGGRLAAAVTAALAPDALVLVSARVAPLPPAAALARRHADALLALRLERLGMDAFMAEWLAKPMFAGLSARQAARGVAASRAGAGSGWSRILRDLSPGCALDAPRLAAAARCWFLAGRDDPAYVREADAVRALRRGRHVDVAIVDAGDGQPTTHALLVEAPAAVAVAVDYACTP